MATQTLDKNGNVVQGGFSTNMTPDQFAKSSAFQTPSTSTNMPSSVNTNMSMGSISAAPKLQGSLAQTPLAPTDTSLVTSANVTGQSIIEQQQQAFEASQANKENQSAMTDVRKLLGFDESASLAENKANDTSALNNQYGISATAGRIGEIAKETEANNLAAKARIQQIGANLGGITNSDNAGFQEQINRQTASKNLMLAAESLTLQGKFDSANTAIKNAIDTKYAGQEARLANLVKFLDLNKDAMGREGEKQKALAEAKAKDLQAVKKNEADIGELVINASSQNAPQALRDKAMKAKTPLEAANILGVYAGDYRKGLLLEAQIKTEKSQQANYSSQIQERNKKSLTTTFVTGKDGVVSTLPKAAQDRYYKLQADFDKTTNAYRGAIDAAGVAKALSKDATAQDQTAIIFQFMKTLDPNSTVRESEFALVASTAGLGDRAVNAFKKLGNGQRLNEAQIKDIIGATDKLAANATKNLAATSEEYDRRASLGGLPKGLFLDGKTVATNPNDSPEAQAIKAKMEAANPALKKQVFEGTSIIKTIKDTAIDFDVPLPTTKK